MSQNHHTTNSITDIRGLCARPKFRDLNQPPPAKATATDRWAQHYIPPRPLPSRLKNSPRPNTTSSSPTLVPSCLILFSHTRPLLALALAAALPHQHPPHRRTSTPPCHRRILPSSHPAPPRRSPPLAPHHAPSLELSSAKHRRRRPEPEGAAITKP